MHLVGTVCLFIGTKLEDVSPLLMKTVLTKLAENTYSEETIRAKEQEILKVLEFKLSTPTVLELVESQLYQLNIGQNKLADVLIRFLTKLAVFDFETSQNSGKLLASAISQVILKLLGKQNNNQK